TQSVSERSRWLKTPNEIMTMPMHEQIINPDGEYPVLANKIQFYKDPEFKNLFITREESFAKSKEHQKPPPSRNLSIETDLKSIIYNQVYNQKEQNQKNDADTTSTKKERYEANVFIHDDLVFPGWD